MLKQTTILIKWYEISWKIILNYDLITIGYLRITSVLLGEPPQIVPIEVIQ